MGHPAHAKAGRQLSNARAYVRIFRRRLHFHAQLAAIGSVPESKPWDSVNDGATGHRAPAMPPGGKISPIDENDHGFVLRFD